MVTFSFGPVAPADALGLAAGLAEADDDVKKLDHRLTVGARPAPIDDAAMRDTAAFLAAALR